MRVLRTTRNIFSQRHGSRTSCLILHHIGNDILREVVLQDKHITYDRLLFQGTVSSIEVKSTCSSSPGPLQVKGCIGAIGGAASNLRQRPHFLMRLRRSRAIPATRIAPASERWSGVGLGVPPPGGTHPLPHCGVFEAPQLKDGLLGRPDLGLAIQEAVLEEQLPLSLNIGCDSFLIENCQESLFENFPEARRCFTTW